MWSVARLCQAGARPAFKSAVPVLKSSLIAHSLDLTNGAKGIGRHQLVAQFTNSSAKQRLPHVLRRSANAHPETAFTLGKMFVAGAGAAGLCTLCIYGLGFSNKSGIFEASAVWPTYVRDRIKTTYMYVGGSIVISVAAAMAALRSPAMMRVFASGALLPNLLLTGSLIASGIVVQSIPYKPGLGIKQLSWMAFSALVGGMLAPLSFYGGPALIRAAWYTAGIVGGLSVVAACAPNDQFLKMGGALAIASGLVFAAGIGSMFLPPTTTFGASMHSIFLYGGLVLFSMMLMYNTQRVTKAAESIPPDLYGMNRFDPVAMSMTIFMDIANIFMRLVFMVNGSNKKR